MRLGAARISIRWPLGLPMAGYSARTAAGAGVHLPLHVRALVASANDGARVCLLSVETVCVDAAFTASLRAALEKAHGITRDAVMITATHTHSAPGGTARFPAMGGADAFLGAYDEKRVQFLTAACLEAVERALANQVPVRLGRGLGRADDVGRNRRDPNGPNDPSLAFVRAVDPLGRPVALVYSFACHPTVLDAHNALYSGDLAGAAAARLEGSLGGTVLPLTGAAGDISTRFTRRESNAAELGRLANLLTDGLAVPVAPDDDERVGFARAAVTLPLRPAPDRDELARNLAEARERLAQAPAAEQRLIEAEIEGYQVALAAGPRPASLSTEVQALRLGRTLIVGLPGELFVAYGLALRERLAPHPVLIAGYANDYIGYVPTPEVTGGYEADSALVTHDAGALLLDAAEMAARSCLAAAR